MGWCSTIYSPCLTSSFINYCTELSDLYLFCRSYLKMSLLRTLKAWKKWRNVHICRRWIFTLFFVLYCSLVKSRRRSSWVFRFENEIFKLRKWFVVFKIENHFPKIKVPFSVKPKIFSIAPNTRKYGKYVLKIILRRNKWSIKLENFNAKISKWKYYSVLYIP